MPDRSFVTLTGHITCYRQAYKEGLTIPTSSGHTRRLPIAP